MRDFSPRVFTDADFEELSWHDNPVYGFFIDNDIAQWKSDLVFDLDHIIEWLCGVEGSAKFKLAAATLTFHHVTDLKVNIDWGDSNMQVAVAEMTLDRISRQRIEKQLICMGRAYYRWVLRLNSPHPGGEITFGASGFTQILRQEPVVCDEQKLQPATRPKLRLEF